ncbi:MAG TPA: hypothetical protein VM939_01490 [Gemmatimonadaceae bacterium]|nr:hypothetical protein [Gemmatimonadaceae bacterium]
MTAALLPDLRLLLEQRFPDATPVTHRTAEPVATGIGPLDSILPGGGLPRGRLSVWMPQGGATAILRAACLTTARTGERSAWIDGLGTIAGQFWEEGPVLVRPANRRNSLRAAEELLRCGGFSLIVLAGSEPAGTEMVRLSRAAREGGAAFVALTSHTSMASLRLTSRIGDYSWRRNVFGEPAEACAARIKVRAQSLGWNRETELSVPVIPHDFRLALDPGLPDRRGLKQKISRDL